ncbi:MAG TPA: hypothetical protein DCZ92_14440 [Elusimicrobia bacterium]|nr:MAG: hypothetical protein A2016_09035 [Elusimicrobia bacterium GWF2_62_30]HBA61982.1 hypothetical protein [Elusimicrobiota bacterium]
MNMHTGRCKTPREEKVVRRQLSVHLAASCNLACVYCQCPPTGRAMTRAEVRAALGRTGAGAVCLEGGGEPTISPGLQGWIKFLKARGVKTFMLSTNGVALADMRLARRLAGSVDSFILNLPACDERTYRLATRSVKFQAALKGLENLEKLGAAGKTRLFHIIFRHNYRRLPAFAGWVARHHPDIGFVNFIFMRNVGRAAVSPEPLLPSYTQAVPYIRTALAYLKLSGIKAVIQNTPLCVLGRFKGFAFELHRWRRGDPVLPPNAAPKAAVPACRRCRLEPACCGARPDYLAVHGSGELKASAVAPGSVKPENF